jgi:hypothetical protein
MLMASDLLRTTYMHQIELRSPHVTAWYHQINSVHLNSFLQYSFSVSIKLWRAREAAGRGAQQWRLQEIDDRYSFILKNLNAL